MRESLNFNVKNPWLSSDEIWVFFYEGRYELVDDPVILICSLINRDFPISDFSEYGYISVESLLKREVFNMGNFGFIRVNDNDDDIFSKLNDEYINYSKLNWRQGDILSSYYYERVEPVVKSLKRNVIIDELFE